MTTLESMETTGNNEVAAYRQRGIEAKPSLDYFDKEIARLEKERQAVVDNVIEPLMVLLGSIRHVRGPGKHVRSQNWQKVDAVLSIESVGPVEPAYQDLFKEGTRVIKAHVPRSFPEDTFLFNADDSRVEVFSLTQQFEYPNSDTASTPE